MAGGKPLRAQGCGGIWGLQRALGSAPRQERPPFTDHPPQAQPRTGRFLCTILTDFHNYP